MDNSQVKEYLQKEMGYIETLLARMESNRGNRPKLSAYISNVEIPYIEIKNFVLPERYGDHDEEDIIITLPNYPDTPPNGVYFKSASRNFREIGKALDGHLYKDSTYNRNGHEYDWLHENGYTWVCFHMEDNRWNYNFSQPLAGDCLYKYLFLLFAALEGNYVS